MLASLQRWINDMTATSETRELPPGAGDGGIVVRGDASRLSP